METTPEWWTTDDWATPAEFVEKLEAEFGAFTLDPCARPETNKAPRFFTKDEDGLAQAWLGNVFVNPPYSDPKPWIEKAIAAIQSGEATQVVMLLPANTDVGWFHDLLLPFADVRFVRGRIAFIGPNGLPVGSPRAGSIIARFPRRQPFHC